MKNKIALKLTLYFSAALMVFAIVIGSVFAALFKDHTVRLHKEDMRSRAVAMAQTLSGMLNGSISGGMMGNGQGGYGMYLRFLDQIAMTDAWVVDQNLELITPGMMSHQQYSYADLPQDAEKVVQEVFQGETTFSESFSLMLDTPAITVGTPIVLNGDVVGALLMHAPVKGMEDATLQGIGILAVSMAAALVLSVLMSVILAISFTRPLKRMKKTALLLAGGDYSAQTDVRQSDEIGELAATLDTLSKQLEEASRESERLDKLRRDFVANISHELRTPVTVIRASLEALCDGVVSNAAQVTEYHRQMLKDSVFLESLVNDLLDLSRLQNYDFTIEMQQLNLCDVVNDAVRSIRQAAQPKGIEIKLEMDASVKMVMGDYVRLRQMLLIVLDNAVKFSPLRGALIVSLCGDTVAIRDNGVGIAEGALPYIFDRFYKVKTDENKNGTGLGLAIAKQIADRHNVQITVKNELGGGAKFSFKF